jgi:hypothetical protein
MMSCLVVPAMRLRLHLKVEGNPDREIRRIARELGKIFTI